MDKVTKRDIRQIRSVGSEFKVREDGEEISIEGYFAVFNSNYNICSGMSESIAPGAFDEAMSEDVRALINHDSSLVLGRTKSHTLILKQDARGLWGHIDINREDADAMNLYARVKRGDVDQCSFGFDILDEETNIKDDGSVHWTIKKVELHEVSVCTFPAYESTSVTARHKDAEIAKRKQNELWKNNIKERLKGGRKKC